MREWGLKGHMIGHSRIMTKGGWRRGGKGSMLTKRVWDLCLRSLAVMFNFLVCSADIWKNNCVYTPTITSVPLSFFFFNVHITSHLNKTPCLKRVGLPCVYRICLCSILILHSFSTISLNIIPLQILITCSLSYISFTAFNPSSSHLIAANC